MCSEPFTVHEEAVLPDPSEPYSDLNCAFFKKKEVQVKWRLFSETETDEETEESGRNQDKHINFLNTI